MKRAVLGLTIVFSLLLASSSALNKTSQSADFCPMMQMTNGEMCPMMQGDAKPETDMCPVHMSSSTPTLTQDQAAALDNSLKEVMRLDPERFQKVIPAASQDPNTPSPTAQQHGEFEGKKFCYNTGKEKNCDCYKMCVNGVKQNDSKCKNYCYEDHCKCRSACNS